MVSLLSGSSPIVLFNTVIGGLLTLFFLYQAVYVVVSYRGGEVSLPPARRRHTYAFLIAAHNEEEVIGNLVRSILDQTYPRELYEVFVVADACTDATAERAREAGAVVWERYDLARKGKSWVMDYGFDRILREHPGEYEGFFVFDADNILAPDYVEEMNKAFDMGYLSVTSYRNSKNFASSWVSMGYAVNFVREARYINNARMLLGTSCTVSGSGWLVSERVVRGMHGWDFHCMTEDHQFSTFCIANGIRIGYAPAEFFDEQPVDFRSSWTQRLRWAKGFYQVLFSYFGDLVRAMRRGSWAAYDEFVTLGPASILTVVMVLANAAFLRVGWLSGGYLISEAEVSACTVSLVSSVASTFLVFAAAGAVTVVTERRHIRCRDPRLLAKAVLSYALFMISYIPINVVALFRRVEWVPTRHSIAVTFADVEGGSEDVVEG